MYWERSAALTRAENPVRLSTEVNVSRNPSAPQDLLVACLNVVPRCFIEAALAADERISNCTKEKYRRQTPSVNKKETMRANSVAYERNIPRESARKLTKRKEKVAIHYFIWNIS